MKPGYIVIVGGLVGLVVCGCEEPPSLQPITPPGAYIPKVSPDAEAAQALGETAPTANKAPADASKTKTAAKKPALPTAKGETKTTEGGVKYETLKEGTGPEIKSGQKAVMQYEGKLENGEIFDSTRSSQSPREFPIGTGAVIPGWDEAVPGMKVGEVRKLTIPPEMGYGKGGKPPEIPPSSTLIFEVELVGIK